MYQSPLHILDGMDLSFENLANREELLKWRKKLLTEHAMVGEVMMEVGGRMFSKDEIIKTIDVLMDEPNLAMHLFIYLNKELLGFMEQEENKPGHNFFRKLIINEEIAPALHGQLLLVFRERIDKSLARRNFKEAHYLQSLLPEFLEYKADELNETIYKRLSLLTSELEDMGQAEVLDLDESARYLTDINLSRFLNRLPDMFSNLVDRLVTLIINLLVKYSRLDHSSTRFTYKVSVMLTNIKCSEELTRVIKSNHLVFSRHKLLPFTRQKEADSRGSPGLSVFGFIALSVFIIRVMLTCDKYDKPKYSGITFNDALTKMYYNEKYSEEVNKLNKYRSYLSFNLLLPNRNDTKVVIFDSCSRTSPLIHLKQNLPEDSLMKKSYKVIINNQSGHDLLIFVFDTLYVWNAYFYNNRPDTLNYINGMKLFLYLGDTLVEDEVGKALNKGGEYRRFKYQAFPDKEIYNRDYSIKLNDSATQGKKRKKRFKPATLTFTGDFYNKDSIVTERLKLYRLEKVFKSRFQIE